MSAQADKINYLLVLDTIAQLPEEDQKKVKAVAKEIEEVIAKGGDAGVVALALVGAKAALPEGEV